MRSLLMTIVEYFVNEMYSVKSSQQLTNKLFFFEDEVCEMKPKGKKKCNSISSTYSIYSFDKVSFE